MYPTTGHPLHQYGSAMQAAKARRRPSRINLPAMCISLFLPWLLFSAMYSLMSFSLHYNDKTVCYLLVGVGFLVVLAAGKMAVDSIAKSRTDFSTDPSWSVFLGVATLVAWTAGVILGDLNFFYNMEPFYDISNLNTYPSVDPATMPGQQVMDAGRMTFVQGTKLDLKKTMAFRNLDVYCVAPIVNNNSAGVLGSYDYWAVGMNCCTGRPGSFGCGEYNNIYAKSGLRVMRDDQKEFYHLAVKQAEAAYNIKAKHPLFFYWMQDPVAEVSAYMDEGFKYYVFGIFTFFAFMLFAILVTIVLLAKMG